MLPSSFQANVYEDYSTISKSDIKIRADAGERNAASMSHKDDAVHNLEMTLKNHDKLLGSYYHQRNIEEIRKQRDCELDMRMNHQDYQTQQDVG